MKVCLFVCRERNLEGSIKSRRWTGVGVGNLYSEVVMDQNGGKGKERKGWFLGHGIHNNTH